MPTVAVDAMGSDSGPKEIVRGAVEAHRASGFSVVLVGDEETLREQLAACGAEESETLSIEHAADVVSMEDSPAATIRKKPKASVRVAFELVSKGRADAVVSAGNTGAMMVAGISVVGTLPSIVRPAIGSLIPKMSDASPTVLIDSGANIDCHAHQLLQFALMGSHYSRIALDIEEPRVALLSNGTEPSKGTDVIRSASFLMRESEDVNYIGYVEGRDLPRDVADVVVCDGFVGNVLLKAMEGSVELVVELMRRSVARDFWGRIGLWLARSSLRAVFREKLDPASYGGAPLLGLNCVAVVCHGSSGSRAIRNAAQVAAQFVERDLVGELVRSLSCLDKDLPDLYQEDGVWSRVEKRLTQSKKNKGGPKSL